jgi:hypothetical protein
MDLSNLTPAQIRNLTYFLGGGSPLQQLGQQFGSPLQQLAGEVVPIRPAGSPADNAARAAQRLNLQRQRPNMLDPANANIIRLSG